MPESTPDKKPPAPSTRRLSLEGRRALEMLAASGPTGATEAIMLAHGFSAKLLASMVRGGLVTGATGTMRAGARLMQVRRLSITDAGRWSLVEPPRRRPFRT
jgi:hypothetical protein